MTGLGPDPYISKNFPSKEVFAQNSTGILCSVQSSQICCLSSHGTRGGEQ